MCYSNFSQTFRELNGASGGEWKVGVDFIHGASRLFLFFLKKKKISVCSSQISRFNHANRFRNSNSSTSCFLIKIFLEKTNIAPIDMFLKKKTKSVYLPRFHVSCY